MQFGVLIGTFEKIEEVSRMKFLRVVELFGGGGETARKYPLLGTYLTTLLVKED